MPRNNVVLLRHGESEFNASNLFCGWHDALLTRRGLQDVLTHAAAKFRELNMSFDFIFTSLLRRAQQTVDAIVEANHYRNVTIVRDWRLNERHYGNLTGFNKRQIVNRYGEDVVQNWRRSIDGVPPSITSDNPFYVQIRSNPNFNHIPPDKFPTTESLRMVIERVSPMWEEDIFPKVLEGKRVLVVAHGTVLRGLMKYIEDIPNEEIINVNVPYCVPCVYQYEVELGLVFGKVQYLADTEHVKSECARAAAIGN